MKKKTNGALRTYKSYLFRDKDPAIDEFRTVVEKHLGRRVDYAALREIENNGGPTVGCMAGWFFGETKRPTNPTMEAAGRSLGYRRVWVRDRKNSK